MPLGSWLHQHKTFTLLVEMPSSSTRPIYNGSENDAKPHGNTNSGSSHTGAIHRFLADEEQPRFPAFGKLQSPVEAKAAAKARMMAQLRAFEAQFGSSGKAPVAPAPHTKQ
ncbi:hypothetical protein V8C42DRAFT_328487 [Trichoderma barbatum]